MIQFHPNQLIKFCFRPSPQKHSCLVAQCAFHVTYCRFVFKDQVNLFVLVKHWVAKRNEGW